MSISFPDSSFDAVRVLKPGGCFLFSVWDRTDRNPMVEVTQRALLSLFPVEVVRGNLVPFSYHEPEVLRADLAAAGFVESELEVVIGRTQANSARAVAFASVQGNFLRPKIEACGPEWLERATETVSMR